MAIKVFNNGKRTIIDGETRFAPKQVLSVSEKIGERLIRLYPGEVMSLEDQIKKLKGADDADEKKPAKTGETDKEKAATPAK